MVFYLMGFVEYLNICVVKMQEKGGKRKNEGRIYLRISCSEMEGSG
jgi:hypothetical protein